MDLLLLLLLLRCWLLLLGKAGGKSDLPSVNLRLRGCRHVGGVGLCGKRR